MNKKVIILKGLPASGKSTWAKEFIKDHPDYKRICKDDLRAMLHDSKFSKEREKFIVQTRDNLIWNCLLSDYNIIVDDTNLHSKHEKNIIDLIDKFSKEYGDKINIEIKFFDVLLKECIKRDAQRPNPLGSEVISRMYRNFIQPNLPKIEYNPNLDDVIICDIDGTLALHNGRSPYDTAKCENDKLNQPIAEIIKRHASGYAHGFGRVSTILVSGRSSKYKQQTLNWLTKHKIPFIKIYMREEGDQREDTIIKKEIYDTYIKGKYNVLFVLDDRNRLVDMWREQGLTCLQVAEGDF